LFDKEPIDKPFVAKKVNARRVAVSLQTKVINRLGYKNQMSARPMDRRPPFNATTRYDHRPPKIGEVSNS